jgi:hypothetical protein
MANRERPGARAFFLRALRGLRVCSFFPGSCWEVLVEDFRQPGLVEALFGDTDHGLVEFINRLVRCDPILGEKIQCTEESGALVAIDVWLVLRDMERIGCGDSIQVGLPVEIFLHRLGEGRFEGIFIPNTVCASESPQ